MQFMDLPPHMINYNNNNNEKMTKVFGVCMLKQIQEKKVGSVISKEMVAPRLFNYSRKAIFLDSDIFECQLHCIFIRQGI